MSSCQKHMRELSKFIAMVAPDHEITVSKGNHLQITVRRDGESRMLFSAKTPGDHRGMLNFRSQVKKAYNEMGADRPRF